MISSSEPIFRSVEPDSREQNNGCYLTIIVLAVVILFLIVFSIIV